MQSGLWAVDSLALARQLISGGALGSKLIFAGGANANATSGFTAVDIYDTLTGLWTTAPCVTNPYGGASVVVGNKFIVAGGFSSGLANASVHIYTLTATGLEEENPKLISVFPNPSSGIFNIEMNQAGKLQVLNATGQVVLDKDFDASENFIQIDLTQNTKGLYLIRFTDRKNQESLVKVIVE